MGSITVGASGSIDPGSEETQCLRDVIERQPCDQILLPSSTNTKNFDDKPWPKTNFTIVAGITGSGTLSLAAQSSVRGDRILFCAGNGTIVVDGTLDASGQGE